MKQRIILFTSTTLAAFVLVVLGGIAGNLMQPKPTQLAEKPAPSSTVQASKPAPFERNRESETDGSTPVKVSEPSFERSQPRQVIDRTPAKQVVRTYDRFEQEDDNLIAYGDDHADREDD
jgi:energy-converting hydrogenase Eha subunit F